MIKVRPLPGEVIVIEASEAERAALATRFGISAVEALRAEVTLEAKPKAIRASGRLTAAIMQPCAVSGEDFAVAIDEPLDLRFVEARARPVPSADEEIEIELEADDCDEIDYTGEMFDLGEAIAQSLGLAIDPYAEGPAAEAARKAAGIVQEGEQLGPLADMLAALRKD
ncbi:MAG: DNA-binding protein [Erythrobacter sp. SCN 62-14]|nr:MAG: DNA-binding protein [Erythrobacter sp. SCN 62-14]